MILGVDTGSRWCAAVALDDSEEVHAAGTHDVNATRAKAAAIDITPTVVWLLGCIAISGAERVAVEHSDAWHPWPEAKPQALAASAANWNVCDQIVRALRAASPVPVEVLNRQTWACRVVPHTSGVSNAKAHAALAERVSPQSFARLSALVPPCKDASHQFDAAGVAFGLLLAPEVKPVKVALPRGMRPKVPRVKNAAARERLQAQRLAERTAAGCRCPKRGRHEYNCALAGRQAKKVANTPCIA